MTVVRKYLCTGDRNEQDRMFGIVLFTEKEPEEWDEIDREFVKEFTRSS